MAEESNTLDLTNVPDNVEEEHIDQSEDEIDDAAATDDSVAADDDAAAAEEEAARVAAEQAKQQEEAERVAAAEQEEAARVQAEQEAAAAAEEEESVEQAEQSVEQAEQSVVTDNLCSLKTLVEVLGKWSGNEIGRRNVEELLKEGSEVDENLDDLEKVVEVLQLWIKEGGSTFREHNHFKNLDEYTLIGESRNLSEEKKVEVLKTVTELVVNVSQRKVTNEEIQNIMNSLY